MLLGSSLSLGSSARVTAPQLPRIQCRRGNDGIEERKLQTDIGPTKQAAILATHDMISTTYPVTRCNHVMRRVPGGPKMYPQVIIRIYVTQCR
jgi:hypothetical protein